jgi:hypothetical protein
LDTNSEAPEWAAVELEGNGFALELEPVSESAGPSLVLEFSDTAAICPDSFIFWNIFMKLPSFWNWFWSPNA